MTMPIDVGDLMTQHHVRAVEAVGRQIQASRSTGLFRLVNHGVPALFMRAEGDQPAAALFRSSRGRATASSPSSLFCRQERALRHLCIQLLPCLSVAAGQGPGDILHFDPPMSGRMERVRAGRRRISMLDFDDCLFAIVTTSPACSTDGDAQHKRISFAATETGDVLLALGAGMKRLGRPGVWKDRRMTGDEGPDSVDDQTASLVYRFGEKAAVIPMVRDRSRAGEELRRPSLV